jgi:hypothetical protein
MGITFHEYKFLEYITENNSLGDILTLGRLEVILSKKDLLDLKLNNTLNENDKYAEKILKEVFKANSVSSLDNSKYENADEILDLNLPIHKNFKKYDSVIDFGTSEHIFNVSQCLKNISSLCKINGQIIHCLPANNSCGHGFWQFSPELFFSLYSEENGFKETEIFIFDLSEKKFWWSVKKQLPGERLELNSDVPLYVACRTKKILEKNDFTVQQSDYKFVWDKKNIEKKEKFKKSYLSSIIKKIKNNFKKFLINSSLFGEFFYKLEGKKFAKKKFYFKNRCLIKKSIKN